MKHWSSLNFISLTLLPISLVFCTLSKLRRIMYKFGLLRSWKAPIPVIVVGNISVGGTGKTPVVIALAEYLKTKEYKPGIVSRGYASEPHQNPLIVDERTAAKAAGDEAVMIFRRTRCPVCVDRNRVHAIQTLLENEDCNIIISDDGMQHYAMQRDFELVVVDGEKLHGNRICLPSGPLRESVSRLQESDFVLVNRYQQNNDGKSFVLSTDIFKSVDNSTERPVDVFSGQHVHAVAGTASPDRFFTTLKSLGISVTEHVFSDHYSFTESDFKAMQDHPIIMTEKDAVKCGDFELSDAWFLSVSAQLPEYLCFVLIQALENCGKKDG